MIVKGTTPLDQGRNDADYYDYYALGTPGDVEFYVQQALSAGGAVLELGCGTGRVTIPTARAGVEIVGLDLSPQMLVAAAAKAQKETQPVRSRLEWVEGNMRTFSLSRKFALITMPFRSFQCMLTVDDQLQCLAAAARHLEPGGRLAFDVFDPDINYVSAHLGPLGEAMKLHARFTYSPTGGEVLVWETTDYDQSQQVLTQIRTFEELRADHVGSVRLHSGIAMRYTFRYEMEHLLRLAGYEVAELYCDFTRSGYQPGSDQVWVAKAAR